MFPAEGHRDASAAGAITDSSPGTSVPWGCDTPWSRINQFDNSAVMERWQTETEYLQDTTPFDEISASLSDAHASSVFASKSETPPPSDRTGQAARPGMLHAFTTALLWEDEGCLCYQVEARGVLVARREDNHMINGTKLLNVTGMLRGPRDALLKSEKTRHVVKIGPMHLKGVWIPFERALELANQHNITEQLYPLFVRDIASITPQPANPRPDKPTVSQSQSEATEGCGESSKDDLNQLDVPEDSDKSSQALPLYVVRNAELHEEGLLGSLFKSLTETLGLILIEVRNQSDMTRHYTSLESTCATLFFWGTDLGLSRGELDDMLQDSPQLRDTCLAVLVSISQFVSTSLIHLIIDELRRREVLQSKNICSLLEQTTNLMDQPHDFTYQPEQDAETLCQTLRTKIDTLIMLAPSLASPAAESFDDEEPRAIQDKEENLPGQAYTSSISEKFPLAPPEIVAQLGKLNWDRYNHILRMQREAMQQELQTAALEKARTIFHDSGIGASVPTQSEVATNAEPIYEPSMMSSRAEASHKRVPPLSTSARSGEPFTCEICEKQVQFRRTKAWKKHVFDDILAYACFFPECHDSRVFFENGEGLMAHLQDRHDMDVRVSEVTCPLCEEFTSGDYDVLSLHIARHMEEIALAILPSGVDPDEGSADDSSNHSDSPNGHETMSYASLDELDPYWMQFKSIREGVVTEYTIRTDIREVYVDYLSHGFKIENCIYPRALVPKDQYKGSDLDKEKTCNDIGWALAELNPSLQGHRGVLQEAVESIFDVSKTGKKRNRYYDSGQVLGNPYNIRKPPPRLTASNWELHKGKIVQFYVTENRPLSEVCQTMERLFGFVATHSQYRTRFGLWGLRKSKKGKTETVAAETPVSSLSEKSGSAWPTRGSVGLSEDNPGPITEAESHLTLQSSELQDAPKSKERTSRLTPQGCPGGNWTCKAIDAKRGTRWASLRSFREHYTRHHLKEHRRDGLASGFLTCHLCGSAAAFPEDGDALATHIFYSHMQT